MAPGGSGASGADNNVISTTSGGGYASSAGTSMAVPHVSGAVALLLAQGLSPSAAVSRLLGGLDRVPCGAGCQGRLNVALPRVGPGRPRSRPGDHPGPGGRSSDQAVAPRAGVRRRHRRPRRRRLAAVAHHDRRPGGGVARRWTRSPSPWPPGPGGRSRPVPGSTRW